MAQWAQAEKIAEEREASGAVPREAAYADADTDAIAERVATEFAAEEASEGKTRDDKGRFKKGEGDGQAQGAQSAQPKQPKVAGDAARSGGSTPKGEPAREDGTAGDVPEGEAGKLAELRELAAKHGYTLTDSGRVEVRERAQFREEQRSKRQAFEAERARFDQEVSTHRQQLQQQAQAVIAAKRALDSGDFDAFAQAMGEKDWNAINSRVINQFADPNYRRMLELEQRDRLREAEVQRQREESARVQTEQQRAQERQAYMSNLSTEMGDSDDPLVAAFADDPAFVRAVFRLQEQHYDGVETISVADAVNFRPKGGRSLREEMRAVYTRLVKAGLDPEETSDQAALKPEPAKAGGRRDAPKPVRKNGSTSISRKDASDAAPNARTMSDAEFFRYGSALLKNADDARK
jgi:hypothetical protein